VPQLSETITSTKSLSIIGTNGTPVIDGGGAMRCLSFGSSTTGTVANVFITGGYALEGGGVYMYAGTVSDCVFSNNVAHEEKDYRGGGGLHIRGGTETTVSRCTFVDNHGYWGGGLYIFHSAGDVLVDNCTFHANIGGSRYGGLCDYDNGKTLVHTSTVITRCVFSSNVASNSYGAANVTGIMTHSSVISNAALVVGSMGGGMRCTGLIADSVITDNQANRAGGGVYGGTILNSIIRRNQCLDTSSRNFGGGGVYNPTLLQNCIIEDNSVAGNWGGGVFLSGGTIENCLIKGNRALGSTGGGGGVRRYSGGGIIRSCTIVSNYSANAGGGIYDNNTSTSASYENNIIYFNTADGHSSSNYLMNATGKSSFTNCCLAPALTGLSAENSANNIISDPLFVAPEDDDWHLSGRSPCVNGGVARDWMLTATDLDRKSRLNADGGVDIGCYQHVPEGFMLIFR